MSRRGLWLMLPRQLRELPADLAFVIAFVAVTNLVVFVPVLNESPVRVVVGLAFVLFLPGYAFIAALFPEAGEPPQPDDEDGDGRLSTPVNRDRGIDGIERVALAFGLSIAIVPLIGLALNFTPFGIRLVPIITSISLFTVIAAGVAAVRRWELPEDERFRVPYRRWIAGGKDELFNPDSRFDAALNIALALSILLATSSVVYAVAVPPQGEQFSEFYILTEDDEGELVAADYPETLVADELEPLHVGVGNNEHESVEYTVIVQLQHVEGEGNESQVINRAELDRWSVTLSHNETAIDERDVGVTAGVASEFEGEDRRLQFLLYDGEVAEEPTRENAYRDLHLWVDIETNE